MTEIIVLDMTVNQLIDIKNELTVSGYFSGVDYDFAYRPPKFDNYSGDAVYNRAVIFTFYNEHLATIFGLKYL